MTTMLDLERRCGPLRLRAWGLILNFVFNALALYGLTRVLTTEGGAGLLALGIVGTGACVALLARPVR